MGEAFLVQKNAVIKTPNPTVNLTSINVTSINVRLTNNHDRTVTMYYELDNALPNANTITVGANSFEDITLSSLSGNTTYTLYVYAKEEGQLNSDTLDAQFTTLALGLNASAPASSATELRDLGYSSGAYWINWGGTTKQVYCDMDNNGGGWMLYASFATDNDYYQAAITKSRMLQPEFNTYGFDLNYRTHWSDGVNGSLAYTRRPGWFAHFYSSSPNGQFTMTSYQGPTNVSEMRIRHGGGATSYSGPSGYVMTNGVNRGSGPSNPTGTTITVASFNPSGSTPLFRQVEKGIAGLSDIWVR